MPFEPAWVLWVLLGACKIHGGVEMGNEVGRRFFNCSHTIVGDAWCYQIVMWVWGNGVLVIV
jgi:hypothetical protein